MDYLHGYDKEEQNRLLAQSEVLSPYIFRNLPLASAATVLEVGMGVGAQTAQMLQRFPQLQVTGVELSDAQIEQAQRNLSVFPAWSERWEIIKADARDLSVLEGRSFDAVVFIWVLEHIPNPGEVLSELFRTMASGTKIYCTEVFHDSLRLYPECPNAMDYWQRTIDCQAALGGDANIGLRLPELLEKAGFRVLEHQPCVLEGTPEDPEERLTLLKYWKDLMYSALGTTIAHGFADESHWEAAAKEMDDLQLHPDASIYYHSFQAQAIR